MVPTDGALVQQLAEAFKSSGSVLALSRSPLAQGPLVAPALVLDELSPTLDERGQALRHALQWAVEQLAPEPAPFPFGSERPLDDPTWRDPHWWRYSILRHRYLEPLHPDEFVEGGRYTETLLALTGIPSADLFYDERNRALREAAQWLQRQAQQGVGSGRIRILALAAVWEPLAELPAAQHLLGIASVFGGIFPAQGLLAMAAEETVRYPERALEALLARRCLHAGDGAASLWMSPALRQYVASRQLAETQRRRHLLAARLARDSGMALEAVRHLLAGGLAQQAAALLLSLDEETLAEAGGEIAPLIQAVDAQALAPAAWRELQLLLADLLQRSSQTEAALAACREALKEATAPRDQALIYRRLGKLYEEQNQAQALTYYNLAADRLDPADPEYPILLKDRGWLSILRRDWSNAEADLDRALELLAQEDDATRADVQDALSALRRGLGDLTAAMDHARTALALREQSGDLMRVGKSFNTLGILYRMMGEYASAIDAYRQARAIFERLDNQQLAAMALLNIGTAFHFAEQLAQAEEHYRQCLSLADEANLPLTEVRARANLVEALMDQQREDEARLHWRAAYGLGVQAGFDDELAYLRELCARYPALEGELASVGRTPAAQLPAAQLAPPPAGVEGAAPAQPLDADETRALEEALRTGRVSAAGLMAAAHVSKATATRKLARLEKAGLLVRHAQGRATYYTRAHAVPAVILAGDLAGLQTRLEAILPRFAQSYGLERLEASRVAQAAAPDGGSEVCYDVRAVFQRLPDLRAFFDLERALSAATRTSINLTL